MNRKSATFREFKAYTLAVARGERTVDPSEPKVWHERTEGGEPETAREAECSEDGGVFDENLKQITQAKATSQKTIAARTSAQMRSYDMAKTDMSNIDPVLSRELGGKLDDYELHEFAYPRVGKHYQVAWNATNRRACVVRVRAGAAGLTRWVSAESPEHAMELYAIGDVDDP